MRTNSASGARRLRTNRRYLIANRTDAVIYAEKEGGGLAFLRRLRNPSGRRHERDLVADKPGTGRSSAGNGTIHHALDRNSMRHERSAEAFAAVVARAIGRECEESTCRGLVLVAEPHFLGMLRARLPERTRKIVIAEVGREFVRLGDREVSEKVFRAIGGDFIRKPKSKGQVNL